MDENVTELEKRIEEWRNTVYDPELDNQQTDYKKDVMVVKYSPRISFIKPPLSSHEWINKLFYKVVKKSILKGCYISSISIGGQNEQEISEG